MRRVQLQRRKHCLKKKYLQSILLNSQRSHLPTKSQFQKSRSRANLTKVIRYPRKARLQNVMVPKVKILFSQTILQVVIERSYPPKTFLLIQEKKLPILAKTGLGTNLNTSLNQSWLIYYSGTAEVLKLTRNN